jgi:hypothetical protein
MSEESAPATESAPHSSFAEQAEAPQPSLFREFGEFLVTNKKWWLIPIIFVLGLLGLFVYFSSTAAPFIYPLF